MVDIEALAREAGIWPHADMHRVATVGELQRDLARFAGLVAERCARMAEANTIEANREAGEVAAGMLERSAEQMRAAFPMPKE